MAQSEHMQTLVKDISEGGRSLFGCRMQGNANDYQTIYNLSFLSAITPLSLHLDPIGVEHSKTLVFFECFFFFKS